MKAGDKFTETFRVTDEIYKGFIDLFQDKNFMHMDDEKAQERGFKSKIMHGNILNGFISFFIGECLPVKTIIIHKQTIQYRNPIFLNDILDFEAKINGVHESVNAVEFIYKFKNTKAKVVAKGDFQIGILR